MGTLDETLVTDGTLDETLVTVGTLDEALVTVSLNALYRLVHHHLKILISFCSVIQRVFVMPNMDDIPISLMCEHLPSSQVTTTTV